MQTPSSRREVQKAELVEAFRNLYFEPTFDPLETTPPGKGVIAPSTLRMESIAASAAVRPDIWFWPMIRKLPPAIPSFAPKLFSMAKSPDMRGIFQIFRPNISSAFW